MGKENIDNRADVFFLFSFCSIGFKASTAGLKVVTIDGQANQLVTEK